MTLRKASVKFVVASGLLVVGASVANAANYSCIENNATWCTNHTTQSASECLDYATLLCSIAYPSNNGSGAKVNDRTGTRFELHSQTYGTKRPTTTRQIRVRRMRIRRQR